MARFESPPAEPVPDEEEDYEFCVSCHRAEEKGKVGYGIFAQYNKNYCQQADWDLLAGFCPGFSQCRVFSAGMKIVINKNLKNTIWQCF
jgi:hypothetical protein